VRQGFRWWEIDVSYYLIWCYAKLGLVWDLKQVPKHLLRDEPIAPVRDWTAVPAAAELPPVKVEEPPFSKAA
jgi:hypothetical protein